MSFDGAGFYLLYYIHEPVTDLNLLGSETAPWVVPIPRPPPTPPGGPSPWVPLPAPSPPPTPPL
ncbi:hypothetical protein E4U21_006857 [Claviceps maximensis]|nr:hypothetical protein E4U21_006857 [Claviceps maximensis]